MAARDRNEANGKNGGDEDDTVTDASPFTRPHEPDQGQRSRPLRGGGLEERRGDDEVVPAEQQQQQQQQEPPKATNSRRDDSDDDDDDEADFEDAVEEEREDGEDDDELSRRSRTVLNLDGDQQQHARTTINKIKIDTVQGDLHIGPQLVQTVRYAGGGGGVPGGNGGGGGHGNKRRPSELSEQEREHVLLCTKSKRRVSKDDIFVVASRLGQDDWRMLGNSLKLNHVVLDRIEGDADGPTQDKIELMLNRWCEARCERATLGRLCKALFLQREFEAIEAITP